LAGKTAKSSWKMFRRFKEEFGFVIGNVFILLAVWLLQISPTFSQTLIIRFTLSLWAAHPS